MKNLITIAGLVLVAAITAAVYADEDISINGNRMIIKYTSFCEVSDSQCERELRHFVRNYRREPITDAELAGIYGGDGMNDQPGGKPHERVTSVIYEHAKYFTEGQADFDSHSSIRGKSTQHNVSLSTKTKPLDIIDTPEPSVNTKGFRFIDYQEPTESRYNNGFYHNNYENRYNRDSRDYQPRNYSQNCENINHYNQGNTEGSSGHYYHQHDNFRNNRVSSFRHFDNTRNQFHNEPWHYGPFTRSDYTSRSSN